MLNELINTQLVGGLCTNNIFKYEAPPHTNS
jgi:hypothetical protein